MNEDNFGDHRKTGTGRVDATTRAPFDMGMGAKKKVFIQCECGRVLEVKKTTVRVMCGECGADIEVDKAKKADDETAFLHTRVHLTSEYLAFRKASEVRAENYKNGNR